MNHAPKYISFDKPNVYVVRTAYPSGIPRDDIQHRLNFGRRTSDNAQDFTRRSLLLQGFAQFRVGRFEVRRLLCEFLEQPSVLDGYDSLVSKGFNQLNLSVTEWLDKVTP